MNSYTNMLFKRAKEYQDKRKAVIDEYESTLARLETAKGSQFYADETKEAKAKKDEALVRLKEEYSGYFNTHIKSMSKANAARKMTPPTEEELRTLQLLRMKDKPTEAELSAAANTLKGNATCLSILTEIAHNAGYLKGYTNYSEAKEISVSDAEDVIKGIASSLTDFLNYDTTKAARIAQAYMERRRGISPDAKALPKRPLFEDKAAFFSGVCGLAGDTLTAFENAVDGE